MSPTRTRPVTAVTLLIASLTVLATTGRAATGANGHLYF